VQRLRDDEQVLQDSLSITFRTKSAWRPVTNWYSCARAVEHGPAQAAAWHWVNQDQLDLHGLHSAEARQLLVAFLNEALAKGWRCVRIVHGKGLRSENREPVLKRKVGNWLAQRDEVLAFVQARPEDGG